MVPSNDSHRPAAGRPSESGELASLRARVAELEMRATFQEDQVEALQKALYEQSTALEELGQRLEGWVQAVRAGNTGEAGASPHPRSLEDDRPPHY